MIRFLFASIHALPTLLLYTLVAVYQCTLSWLLGGQCRFEPTCSNYFRAAVEKHGPLYGSVKGIWRILRCNPFFPGGYDPP